VSLRTVNKFTQTGIKEVFAGMTADLENHANALQRQVDLTNERVPKERARLQLIAQVNAMLDRTQIPESASENLQRAAGAMKAVIFAYEKAGLDQLDRSFPTEMEQLFESTGRTLQGSLSSAIIAGIRDGSDGARRILDNLATNLAGQFLTMAIGNLGSANQNFSNGTGLLGRCSRCFGRWPTAASWTGRRRCSPASAGPKRCGPSAKEDAGDRSRCTSSTRRSWTRANSWRAVWPVVAPRCVS